MLLLGRKRGESILLGEDIEIQVLECGPSGVKLGIRAPRALMILRQELYAGLKDANHRAAAQVSPPEGLKVLAPPAEEEPRGESSPLPQPPRP